MCMMPQRGMPKRCQGMKMNCYEEISSWSGRRGRVLIFQGSLFWLHFVPGLWGFSVTIFDYKGA